MATTTPQHPHLTPQFCFSTGALKEFLRISRSAVDDTISQSLNTLSTPSRTPFDPTSTSRPSRPVPRRLPESTCAPFVRSVLFASWQARTDVLDYCAAVAASDDDDGAPVQEEEGEGERVVDERLDPYSGRYFPRETRAQVLAAVVRNEGVVEEIVRERSWRVVGERCEGVGRAWREAWGEWRADAAAASRRGL